LDAVRHDHERNHVARNPGSCVLWGGIALWCGSAAAGKGSPDPSMGSSGSFLPLCQRETRPLTHEEALLEWNLSKICGILCASARNSG